MQARIPASGVGFRVCRALFWCLEGELRWYLTWTWTGAQARCGAPPSPGLCRLWGFFALWLPFSFHCKLGLGASRKSRRNAPARRWGRNRRRDKYDSSPWRWTRSLWIEGLNKKERPSKCLLLALACLPTDFCLHACWFLRLPLPCYNRTLKAPISHLLSVVPWFQNTYKHLLHTPPKLVTRICWTEVCIEASAFRV